MPTSVLWAVDLFGRVYTLSTAGQYWELCKDVQLEFKRVSAATQCCWGIAGDNQVYLYVCSSDVPIRHREEAYENQRWNPMGGFCEKLLPSDRWPWSDVWGISCEDRAVYFRQGVTPSELSGKTWKAIVVGRESDRSHSGSSSSLLSAGCFFGDEVRGSGTESAPSDTDASLEVERQGPEQPLPKEALDNSTNLKGSLSKGHETSGNTDHSTENACLTEGKEKAPETSRSDECRGPASTPAELPWTNIDLKEPKKVSNQPAAGFPAVQVLFAAEATPHLEARMV